MSGPKRRPAVDRVLARIIHSDTPFRGEPCWVFAGQLDRNGYGQVDVRRAVGVGGRRPAHRVVYEAIVGPVQNGLVLDHLCRVRSCVNPSHLEAVTQRENVVRGLVSNKSHCANGHRYTESTVKVTTQGHRSCRVCARLRDAARRATPEYKAYVSAYNRAYKARRGAVA